MASILNNNCTHIGTGEATLASRPKQINLFIYKGILNMSIESCFKLFSDHSPIILNIAHNPVYNNTNQKIHNSKTNWFMFTELLE